METLGWTLYLPRLLDSFLFFVFRFFECFLFVFWFWSKTLEKNGENGDSWVDPLSPKTFRKLAFLVVLFFCFFCFFQHVFFFGFGLFRPSKQKKNMSRLFGRWGGASPDSQNIVFSMFHPSFFGFFVRSTGFAGTNCHTLLVGPQTIYSSYKSFKRWTNRHTVLSGPQAISALWKVIGY